MPLPSPKLKSWIMVATAVGCGRRYEPAVSCMMAGLRVQFSALCCLVGVQTQGLHLSLTGTVPRYVRVCCLFVGADPRTASWLGWAPSLGTAVLVCLGGRP